MRAPRCLQKWENCRRRSWVASLLQLARWGFSNLPTNPCEPPARVGIARPLRHHRSPHATQHTRRTSQCLLVGPPSSIRPRMRAPPALNGGRAATVRDNFWVLTLYQSCSHFHGARARRAPTGPSAFWRGLSYGSMPDDRPPKCTLSARWEAGWPTVVYGGVHGEFTNYQSPVPGRSGAPRRACGAPFGMRRRDRSEPTLRLRPAKFEPVRPAPSRVRSGLGGG